jgi:hypothetical protein
LSRPRGWWTISPDWQPRPGSTEDAAIDTITDLEEQAAEAFDPALLMLGLVAAVLAIAISALVLWAAWVHLRPQLAEILDPAARRLGARWTRSVHGSDGPGTPWLCVPCRSFNDGRNRYCYRCRAPKEEVEGPPPPIN